MKIAPYLNFGGNCKEAFALYERVLGGKIDMMMTHGESPMADQMGPQMRDKIMHAHMKIGEQSIMGSDAPPQMMQKPQGFFVSLEIAAPEEAERVFKALSEGGAVVMPMEETFWAKKFGMAVDRFGTPWMINCSKPM